MPQDKNTVSEKEDNAQAGEISSDRQTKDTLRLRLKGSWTIGARFPTADVVQKQIESVGGIRRIGFNTQNLTGWDSGLLTFLLKLNDYCSKTQRRSLEPLSFSYRPVTSHRKEKPSLPR